MVVGRRRVCIGRAMDLIALVVEVVAGELAACKVYHEQTKSPLGDVYGSEALMCWRKEAEE